MIPRCLARVARPRYSAWTSRPRVVPRGRDVSGAGAPLSSAANGGPEALNEPPVLVHRGAVRQPSARRRVKVDRRRSSVAPRERILAAARALVRDQGALSFSLREAAARAGMRAPSVYEHFENREALLNALRQETLLSIQKEVLAAAEGASLAEKLLSMSLAYISFAEKHREDFLLCFVEARDPLRSLDAGLPKTSLLSSVAGLVEGALRSGEWRDDEHLSALGISYGLWTMVHGMAMIRVTYLASLGVDLSATNRSAIRAFLSSFAAHRVKASGQHRDR